MIELLLASIIVGKTQIAPNVIQVEYLTPEQSIITILENAEQNDND